MPANTSKIIFPNPNEADDEGLVAYGGNLEVETLLLAYSKGIFPWFSKNDPILWWSPNPRLVLYPDKMNVSKSLSQIIKKNKFTIKIDTQFSKVIRNCGEASRKEQDGTWITEEMIQAYCKLHEEGYAHSFEAYLNDELVGGLYGVSLGKVFFGESMFHNVSDASKVAFFYLVTTLKKWEFHFIDAQIHTHHLVSLGAEEILRNDFLKKLEIALQFETRKGKWTEFIPSQKFYK